MLTVDAVVTLITWPLACAGEMLVFLNGTINVLEKPTFLYILIITEALACLNCFKSPIIYLIFNSQYRVSYVSSLPLIICNNIMLLVLYSSIFVYVAQLQ